MISIIVPFHNEEGSLPVLIDKLDAEINKLHDSCEVILVDDGSTDNSKFKIQNSKSQVKSQKNEIKIVSLRKRFGKGEALRSGIEASKGDILVFMDADLQDDPKDLPNFLKKINEGYDFVNGIRAKRQDNIIVKFYSKIARYFLKLFLQSPFTDINCGFKAFRREVLKDFYFYGNNFRFFPLAIYYQGYKVMEIPVTNNPRLHGKSKFGSSKLFIGILDTLRAYFLYRFSEKPLNFFGAIGSIFFSIGFITALYLSIEKIFFGVLLYRRPALLFAILMIIVGIQIGMTGIIGELIVYLDKKNPKS